MKDIKVQASKKIKQGKVQAKVAKKQSPLQKEIMTSKIPKRQVSTEETSVKTAKIQPKGTTPYIGETWVEKKASSPDGKKRRCLVVLIFSEGGISYVQTVSRVAFDMGDLCPPYIQELGAFLRTWELLEK